MQFHPQWSQWGLFSEEHSGLLGSSHVSENHEEPPLCAVLPAAKAKPLLKPPVLQDISQALTVQYKPF